MIDQRGALAIAELAFYTLALPVAIFVGAKHGFGREAGWFFLITLSVLRIAGACLELAAELEPTPNRTIITLAVTFTSIGTSPLVLITLAMLKRLYDSVPRKNVDGRLFFVLGALPIVGLILSIVGGSDAASTTPGKASTGVNYLEISAILYVVTVVLELVLAAFVGAQLRAIPAGEHKLFYAVCITWPFLLVRVIYQLLSAYNFMDTGSPFNRQSGSIYVQAFMSVLEEFVIVLVFLAAGLMVSKKAAAAAGTKLDGGSSGASAYPPQGAYPPPQGGYAQQGAYPQQGGYAPTADPQMQRYSIRQPYGQQQNGRVAV